MLRANFTTLYDQEVYKAAEINKSKVYNDKLLQKLLNKEPLILEDFNIEPYEERFNALEKEYQEKIKSLKIKTEKNLKELEKEREKNIKALKIDNENNLKFFRGTNNVVDSIKDSDSYKEQTIKIMKFIGQFYPGDISWFTNVIAILCYFNDIQTVENFLSLIDYSDIHAMEQDIFPSNYEKLGIACLTEEEKTLWREINKTYGKEGIKIFSRVSDIKISIIDLYDNNDKDLAKTFKELQEIVKNLKFKDEEKYPEIAALCHKYNATEETFKKIIEEILPKFKTKDNLPDLRYEFIAKQTITLRELPANNNSSKDEFIREFEPNIKRKTVTFKKLSTNENIKALFIGKNTKSCEFVGGLGEEAVISAVTNEDAGFYIIINNKGKIIADCYAWRGKNEDGLTVLMLDSFEHLPEAAKLFLPL